MDKLNVGVIGCGHICSEHVKNIKMCSRMHLVGVADLRREAAEEMKKQWGAEYATDDADKLIGDANIDALLIFASHNAHLELVRKTCEEKKPFFVEKPLALTTEECRKIQAWVKKSAIKNQVGYWFRHSPLTTKVSQAIPSPYLIIARCLRGGGEGFDAKKMIDEADVKAKSGYFDQAGYLFDVVLQLMPSNPVSIQTVSLSESNDVSNTICSHLKFENGAVAAVINGDIGSGGFLGKWFFEIIGGSVNATIVDYRKLVFSPDTLEGVEENEYYNGFREQMDMFARYVLEGGASPMDVWEASKPTLLMEKSVESVKGNRSVPVTADELLTPR